MSERVKQCSTAHFNEDAVVCFLCLGKSPLRFQNSRKESLDKVSDSHREGLGKFPLPRTRPIAAMLDFDRIGRLYIPHVFSAFLVDICITALTIISVLSEHA
jgi:hypothetical protein